jgi:TM2 domain-containing membrane protein YozV/ribosomal protein L40E
MVELVEARNVNQEEMTMFCPNCGAQSADTAKFCEKCGTAIAAHAPAAPAIDTRVRGVETAPTGSVQVATGKSPGIALVLSLVIPGVGQFYNSDIKKGALMLAGAILLGAATGGLGYLAFWIWSMVDAYQVANGKGKIW